MRGSRLGIGVGIACLVVGWGLGFWAVATVLKGGGVSLMASPPAPKVVRTPASQIVPLPNDSERLSLEGWRMTLAQGQTLRQRVLQNPGDAPARARLMGHTMHYWHEEDAERTKEEQIVWFVANMPDASILASDVDIDSVGEGNAYALLKRLYVEALDRRPRDVAILVNYAALIDVPETGEAIALLKRAIAIRPKDSSLYERLGHAHALESRGVHGACDPQQASLALDAFLKARELGGGVSRTDVLQEAYDARRFDLVEREAVTALEEGQADDVHVAHTLLGRLALSRGDVATAKRQLLDSARVKGSPVLDSFGPSMDLAKALLAQGERSTVLAYLVATGEFWKDERQVEWTERLREGKTPDWD